MCIFSYVSNEEPIDPLYASHMIHEKNLGSLPFRENYPSRRGEGGLYGRPPFPKAWKIR